MEKFFFEKLPNIQLVKKFPTPQGTQKFITTSNELGTLHTWKGEKT